MKTPKASPPPPEARPTSARIAMMSFPEDPDLPDRRVIVYFCPQTRH